MIDIEFKPTSLMGLDYEVLLGTQQLALLDRAMFRERASFTLGGVDYDLRTRGWTQGLVELVCGGQVIASVQRQSSLAGRYEVSIDASAGSPGIAEGRAELHWTLKRKSFFGMGYWLESSERRAGEVSRRGYFKRGCHVIVREGVPPVIAVLVGYMVVLIQDRQAAAA